MSNEMRVYPEDGQYKSMYALWEEQKRPSHVMVGSVQWEVLQRYPDNAVFFLRRGSEQDFYSDRSTKGLAK